MVTARASGAGASSTVKSAIPRLTGTANVKAMPTSFLIDAKGNVAMVESGFKDENIAELETRIKTLVGSK